MGNSYIATRREPIYFRVPRHFCSWERQITGGIKWQPLCAISDAARVYFYHRPAPPSISLPFFCGSFFFSSSPPSTRLRRVHDPIARWRFISPPGHGVIEFSLFFSRRLPLSLANPLICLYRERHIPVTITLVYIRQSPLLRFDLFYPHSARGSERRFGFVM